MHGHRARSRWPSPPAGRTPSCTPSRPTPAALTWARRNIAEHVAAGGTPVTLHAADVRWTDLLLELESHVDLVLCNPPYVPDGTAAAARGRRLGPARRRVRRPGRPGRSSARSSPRPPACCATAGALAIEHDDTHGEVVPALLRRRRVLTDVEEHRDLTGRPRFATARRLGLQPARAP